MGALAGRVVGNDGLRAALDQEGAQAVAVVGRVGDAQLRGRQGADKGQGHTSIAQLTWRYLDGAGSSLFVDGKVNLGRAPASGPPDGLALRPPLPPAAQRWALAWVESSRSALGGPPERASVSNTSRHTPRSAQRTKRLYRVFLGPYWGGASAHRPPERSTCTMPEITRRSSTRGTPRVSRGSKGARRANCSSVSQKSGRIEARTGLRMMPTFPRSPLSFRTAGFPQYGWKAGLSGGAFPDVRGLSLLPAYAY